MSNVRDNSINGFILYYFLQVFFVSTYLVGMALSLQLYMNPSFYIQAFCQDIRMSFVELNEMSRKRKQHCHQINQKLLEIIEFQIGIVE